METLKETAGSALHKEVGFLILTYSWVQAVFLFFLFIITYMVPIHHCVYRSDFSAAFFLSAALITFLQFKIAKAIKEHKTFGRIGGVIWGTILLFFFPVGTAMGIPIVWWLNKRWEDKTNLIGRETHGLE